MDVDGTDVMAVWETAGTAIERVRAGQGPIFLHARCIHLEGHFLGFQLIRTLRDPFKAGLNIGGPLMKSFLQPGGVALNERIAGVRNIMGSMMSTWRDPRRDTTLDPLKRARTVLQSDGNRLVELEHQIEVDMQNSLTAALIEVGS